MTEGRIMRERIGDLELHLSNVDKLCDVRRGGPNYERAVLPLSFEPAGVVYQNPVVVFILISQYE